MIEKTTKIYVAMSGGVDSSVAAALLNKQGHDVVGVFFKPWQPEKGLTFCNWQKDRLDAMAVAAKIGIPFKTWDFSKEYNKQVAQYMINSYRAGITPNPDVMCNKEIKFGLFLKKALAEGADYIATGHYVRIGHKTPDLKVLKLFQARDDNKDQSYFLWTLTQKQLKYCLFPVGDHIKPEIRKMAKKFGLPNYAKKDSQGVCFVGQLNFKEFLKGYIESKAGDIVLAESGKIIGQHDGSYYYTIGQRHGLDIKDGGGPYFVINKNTKKNIVYVTKNISSTESQVSDCVVHKVSWIGEKPNLPINCQIKIRYRSKSLLARILKDKHTKTLLIKFKKPVRAITSGQSAVFYRGNEIIGGGIINS